MKTYTVTLEQDDNGHLMLPIPQEVLLLQGWREGDTLRFVDNKDGSWSLFKPQKTLEQEEPRIDDMLRGLLGSDEFVKRWWNSPNIAFGFQPPINCDREIVYKYVCSFAIK
jgi:hypothetical protein